MSSDTRRIMGKLKSDREIIEKRVKARRENARILNNTVNQVKKIKVQNELKGIMEEVIPGPMGYVHEQLAKAKRRIKNTAFSPVETYMKDDDDRDYMSAGEVQGELQEDADSAAMVRHGNDPNIRLDEGGFPNDRADREFMLTHDFGESLKKILGCIEYSWIYLYGDPGRGKTTLATRAVWELIKDSPSTKAQYISVNDWTNSLLPGEEKHIIDIKKLPKIIVLDDFDKFSLKSEFQIRHMLRLVEESRKRRMLIITSNYSRPEILKKNPASLDLEVMLDRLKGKSIDFPQFTGKSFR